MIITRLHGRLGNQMFQYAAAKGLAARHNTHVALDSRLALARNEGVLTRVFDLPLAEAPRLPPARHENLLRYAIWRASSAAFQRERGLGYNHAIEAMSDGTYLHGYWQSERYFEHIAPALRDEFTFAQTPSSQSADMAAQISENLSVSMHIRRGDYLTLGAHSLCDQAYYNAALARICDSLSGAPTVFVFSDDPGWAKENLPLPVPKVVVDFNGPDADFDDMRLMSLCQHNIIANSSFSWWGAWLNANPDKRVAGPARWFGDPRLSNPDILPDTWMTISV